MPWEYYSTIKMNALLIYTTTWMVLKGIMLSEKSPSQEVTCCMVPFLQQSNMEHGLVVARD